MNFNVNGDCVKVNLIWLRDNCRCDQCFNWVNQQKKAEDINTNIQVKSYSIKRNNIYVIWNDGHNSVYDIDWIRTQQRLEERPPLILWKGDEIENKLPTVVCKNNTLTTDCVKTLITSLLQLGVGIVKNVTPTLKATELIVKYIGPEMHTHYGGMWEIKENLLETYKDTAYSKEALMVHTDNTYYMEPAGYLVFHCLKPAEEGGETVLVDGFKAAQLVKEKYAESFINLQTPVEWQYISDEFNFKCVAPILNMNKNTDGIEQIRFNMYDRSPRIPFTAKEDLKSFYHSLKHFRDILINPSLCWRIKLIPGTLLFINNWRIMHGRNKYSGTRTIVGCYQLMNTILSKARILKIIK